LYRDKNYAAETQFVLEQLRVVLPIAPRRILDLGCGTGLHAVQMAQMGIFVTGVDSSADMVAIANKRKQIFQADMRKRLDFRIGDLRAIDLGREYDAALSLFHVMSYLIKDSDLRAAFQMTRRHLHVGGGFIFDFWHGPAVLRDPPRPRTKIIKVGDSVIQRRAIPEWDPKRNVVRVNYDIEIRKIKSGETIREREQHLVRYFFPKEIQDLLSVCGFDVVRNGEWMTGKRPTDNSFSVYVLAKAK
jgi:SAM-dependent methyltransferase